MDKQLDVNIWTGILLQIVLFISTVALRLVSN